jgi:hypothetical protein
MYSSEALPAIAKHSHSSKFFELLGNPIARIQIPALFSGFVKG